ncbi:SLC13 family permease [Massilibacterium senegalense]|uniref:SLC13 family permease n=1 Tax=Massilibacterium senegalense TaxID=1632858 RepID=UPI000780244B|nr:DASS family sodium-coupled anion symporter [Massilibacterium senegalense]
MLQQEATTMWNKLWKMHRETKALLTFFAKPKDVQKKVLERQDGKNEKGPNGPLPSYQNRQWIGLILGPLLFILTLFFFHPEGMTNEARGVLASTLWIATWWITEAIPIPVTSLLPIVLLPLTGALEIGSVTSAYGDGTIFLFLGGFILAIAMEKWGLHKRIALSIILLIGTSTKRIILGFMVATGFLSMWISNTATAMMMMPIGLAIIYQVRQAMKSSEKEEDQGFGKAIMLGIAYSASIGGLGTLIGTPPNSIFAATVNKLYGIQISFAEWMLFGVPIAAFLLILAWVYLVQIAYPLKMKSLPGGRKVVQQELRQLGNMSFEEKLVLIVFSLTAISWITRTFVIQKFIPTIDDTIIAIIAGIILFLLPTKHQTKVRILDWNDAKNLPWGILLLFGGGLAIAAGFKETGLALWIGEQLTVLNGLHLLVVLFIVATIVLFLTEITSNTATATMLFPVMASLALALDVHPYALMIAAGIASSCAFMLPVATPPNAVVFGSGYLKIGDMVKAGFWINLICILLIPLMIYYFLPVVWDIDLFQFPKNFK